ncbi:MAG: alkaline phosphatase D family protein, partial [bacterium]
MKIAMGPILGFRGLQDGQWHVCALIVTTGDETPSLSSGGASTAAKLLHTFAGKKVWRFDWAVNQTEKEQPVDYSIDDSTWKFVVPPAQDDARLRIAYASCNGFMHGKDAKKVEDKNRLWKVMAEQHHDRPYHLLLMGGDQVYADPMWEAVPTLKKWADRSGKGRWKAKFTKDMSRQLERFYMNLYCSRWSQPEQARMFARIPSLMMWDDHDIFDGWGSYPKAWQESPVYQGIFAQGSKYFSLLQLQARPDDLPDGVFKKQLGFSYGYQVGDVAILALDTRCERTQKIIMGPEAWDKVYAWLDGLTGCKHLLVMASIPVVYPDFGLLEKALAFLPGQQSLEDDLKDHWRSKTHKAERLRLIHRLLAFSEEKRCRVSILSGDVHVAALGVIESNRGSGVRSNAHVINQLVSSAIVNVPPPAAVVWFYEKIGDTVEKVDRGITAQLLTFPATDHRFIGERNYLSLSLDDKRRIWADWFV